MNRNEIVATLRAHEADLRQSGVGHAAAFGSAASGEATAGSDIIILQDLDQAVPIARLKR